MPTDFWVPFIVGLVLLLGSLGLSYLPNLPPLGRQVLRVLLATGAGFITYGLAGTITFGGGQPGFELKASMGFAVFALVFLADPPARIARWRAAAAGQVSERES